MKKKVYMIHGWEGSSEDHWFPWLKEELEKRKENIEIEVFDMPNSKTPKIEEWVGYLERRIKNVDEHTYFIGHSIGCQTIMRFLEKLHKDKKIGGCFFVAPWMNLINLDPEEMTIAHPWLTHPFSFSRILGHCNNFLSIFSKDDPIVPISDAEVFEKELGSKIVIVHDRKHFTEEKEPAILNEALRFIK